MTIYILIFLELEKFKVILLKFKIIYYPFNKERNILNKIKQNMIKHDIV